MIILISFSSNIYCQNESIKVEIFLSKDTIRLFEPLEYCIRISNISNDSIRTSSYNWRNFRKPALEIKSKHNPKWIELWHSNVEIDSECEVYINPNCWMRPKEQFYHLPPDSSYLIKSVYYPLWKIKSQNLIKEPGNYKIRSSTTIKPFNDLTISTVEKQIYIEIKNSDKEFLRGLQKKSLNTYELFVPWNLCGIDTTNMKKFLDLKDEYKNHEIGNWIEFQNLNKDLCWYKYKFELDHEYKVLANEQKNLIIKMIKDGFFPIDYLASSYNYNIETGLGKIFDIDEYFIETDFFNKETKLYKTSTTCQ